MGNDLFLGGVTWVGVLSRGWRVLMAPLTQVHARL